MITLIITLIIIIWVAVFSYFIGMERGYNMGLEDKGETKDVR